MVLRLLLVLLWSNCLLFFFDFDSEEAFVEKEVNKSY